MPASAPIPDAPPDCRISASVRYPSALSGAAKGNLLLLLCLGVGCSAEPSLGADRDHTRTDADAPTVDEAPPANSESDNPEPGPTNVTGYAPGIPDVPYPRAPYGTLPGAVMADLAFTGWRNPADAAYDVAATETIRLSDFYDPEGTKGIEYILFNAVTVWCSVCRLEYEQLQEDETYATYSARGLEIVGVLFEDNNGNPPTYLDLSNWSARYDVAFPFVTDPGFKTGVYFDRDATPMNMVIDARTMEIVLTMTGYNPAMYDQIDNLLTARGR